MALIAIHAVVHIAADALVIGVRVRLRMAVGALEHAVVAGIGVAGRADATRVPVIGVEPGVIENRARPGRGVVAHRAGGRKTRGDVIGIGRCRVFILVAAITIGRNAGVVVIHVAVRARYRGMRARQGKTGVVVIEGRRSPGGRVVAHIALLREPRRRVIRAAGLLILRQVARDTSRVGQIVGGSAMTLAALQAAVRTRQRPSRARVIKRR